MSATLWRIVARSSMNSTSSVATRTSVTACDRRITFSRLSRIFSWRTLPSLTSLSTVKQAPPVPLLTQNQLSLPCQLALYLLVHLLIIDAGAAHLSGVLTENGANFFIETILDPEF